MAKKSPSKMAKNSPFLFGKLLSLHFKMNLDASVGGSTGLILLKCHQVSLPAIKFRNMFILSQNFCEH